MTRKEYDVLLEEAEIYKKVSLSKEEAEGRDDVVKTKSSPNRMGISEINYYRMDRSDELSNEEIKIALMAKQTVHLKSIRSMVTFFTTVSVIGIVAYVFLLLMNFMS